MHNILKSKPIVLITSSLKFNMRVSMGLLDRLPRSAGGFLNRAEMVIQNKPNDSPHTGQLIDIMQGKTNGKVKVFCNLLWQCNYAVWADELEKKARSLEDQDRI